MNATVFVDTNVLVYALDAAAGDRHVQARTWMDALWASQRGRVSTQVLQEFYVTTTRKLRPGLSADEAQREVRALTAWSPLEIGMTTMERACHVEQRYQFSWWDALIVASAQASGCRYLLTEDLQHGQDLDGLLVCSPFRMTPDALSG
ncbi:MAG: PIN domain-containing protein [Gemmatimonadetes bacterium]|nr:PIN domain-containing protein [Gemmatimonadota bacterium]